jgi:hypothetical protein
LLKQLLDRLTRLDRDVDRRLAASVLAEHRIEIGGDLRHKRALAERMGALVYFSP